MSERRRLKRWHLIKYLDVYNKDSDQLLGQLVDITVEGLRLKTTEPVEKNEIYNMKILLTESLENAEEINIRGEAVWVEKEKNSEYFGAGINLIDVTTENKNIISALTHQLYSFSTS